jgi:hypothetical protein
MMFFIKNQSNKAENFDLRKEKPMHLILKNIMKTNLIYENRRLQEIEGVDKPI